MATALVCDDDGDICSLVGIVVRSQGYVVHTAGDVAGALSVLRGGGIDLVVTDVALPDGSGVTVCEAGHAAGARVVTMTAQLDDELAAAVRACSAAVLRKPFSLGELLDAIGV